VFRHDGHDVFVRRGGDLAAPALLLVHGFPTASWDYAAVWPALAARWRLVTLDLLGFGWSAKPRDHPYSIDSQADLVEALLRHDGITRYHVLAHDYGDTVVQELLARGTSSPRLVSACLLNGGIIPEAHHPLPIQRLLSSPVGGLAARLSSRRLFEASMRRIFAPGRPPSREELAGFWTLLDAGDGRAVLAAVSRYRHERRARRDRWVGALAAARVPLRLVIGTADPIAGTETARCFRALVADADVVELTGVGHYPQIEAPGVVVDAYREFRGRLPA
jgi:pimeloyl-ACP methyl ester carboxylesterase